MFERFFILSFLLTGAAFGQLKIEPANYQFGNVHPGKTYSQKFKISNSSAQSVTLSIRETDCECIKAKFDKNVIHPKGFVSLKVDYTPIEMEKAAKIYKITFVASENGKKNTSVSKEWSIQLSANVLPLYTFRPEGLYANVTDTSKVPNSSATLILSAENYSKWRFLKAESDSNSINAFVKPLTTPLAYSVQLKVKEELPPGLYKGHVTIKGEGGNQPNIEYPYQIMVQPNWVIEPSFLVLPERDPQKMKNWKSVTQFRQITPKPYKIVEIKNKPSWLKYSLETKSGSIQEIHWEIDGNVKLSPEELSKPIESLILATDAPSKFGLYMPVRIFKSTPPPPGTPKTADILKAIRAGSK